MSSQTLPFYERVESALHDQTLQTALGRATTRFVANRANALEALIDADGLRDQARSVRAKALARLDELLEQLADQVEARGGQVCWAEDGAAACRYIADLAHDRSEEHTSELQSLAYIVCRLLHEKKKNTKSDISNNEQIKLFIKSRIN